MGNAASALGNVKNAHVLVASVGGNLAVGSVLGSLAMPSILGWYKRLEKPVWTPPNAVFGPVWSALYASMGVASWMVFNKGGPQAQRALMIYGAQLAFNFGWQPLMFNAKRVDLALVDITLLLASSVATTVAFGRIDRRAGLLFSPLVLWVAYATALNASILVKNPQAHKIDLDEKDL